MKNQLTPTKGLKVGQVLYKALSYTDDETNRVSTEVQEWVVRSHRRLRSSLTKYDIKQEGPAAQKYYNLSHKIAGLTWDKKSGWHNTPSWCDMKFSGSDKRLPRGLYTTPLKAVEYQIYSKGRCLDFWRNYHRKDLPSYYEMEKETFKEIKALKSRLNKLKKAKHNK